MRMIEKVTGKIVFLRNFSFPLFSLRLSPLFVVRSPFPLVSSPSAKMQVSRQLLSYKTSPVSLRAGKQEERRTEREEQSGERDAAATAGDGNARRWQQRGVPRGSGESREWSLLGIVALMCGRDSPRSPLSLCTAATAVRSSAAPLPPVLPSSLCLLRCDQGMGSRSFYPRAHLQGAHEELPQDVLRHQDLPRHAARQDAQLQHGAHADHDRHQHEHFLVTGNIDTRRERMRICNGGMGGDAECAARVGCAGLTVGGRCTFFVVGVCLRAGTSRCTVRRRVVALRSDGAHDCGQRSSAASVA